MAGGSRGPAPGQRVGTLLLVPLGTPVGDLEAMYKLPPVEEVRALPPPPHSGLRAPPFSLGCITARARVNLRVPNASSLGTA